MSVQYAHQKIEQKIGVLTYQNARAIAYEQFGFLTYQKSEQKVQREHGIGIQRSPRSEGAGIRISLG